MEMRSIGINSLVLQVHAAPETAAVYFYVSNFTESETEDVQRCIEFIMNRKKVQNQTRVLHPDNIICLPGELRDMLSPIPIACKNIFSINIEVTVFFGYNINRKRDRKKQDVYVDCMDRYNNTMLERYPYR